MELIISANVYEHEKCLWHSINVSHNWIYYLFLMAQLSWKFMYISSTSPIPTKKSWFFYFLKEFQLGLFYVLVVSRLKLNKMNFLVSCVINLLFISILGGFVFVSDTFKCKFFLVSLEFNFSFGKCSSTFGII